MSKFSSVFGASVKAAKKPAGAVNLALDLSPLKVLVPWPGDNDSFPSTPKKKPSLFAEQKSILSNGSSTRNSELPSSSSKDSMLASILDIPWFSSNPPASVTQRRKEVLRGRKQKWVFKQMQSRRFERLIRICAKKLGAEETLEVFSKLGRENGIKEYNALIELCMETARTCSKEDDSMDQVHKALQLLQSMREQGFDIEEGSYGPLLQYFADKGMIDGFELFSQLIMEGNSDSFFRVGYYEMLLWVGVGNDDKVQEMCNYVRSNLNEDNLRLAENYLLALCKNDRKNELLILLEVVDIATISSLEHLSSLFSCFGRLSLLDLADKCILALKVSGREVDDLSSFICNFAKNCSNFKVDEVVEEFHRMHERLEVKPSSSSYFMLVTYCSDSLKVQAALDVVEKMCSSGLSISIEMLHPIFRACEQTCDFDLVHSIYLLMDRLGLKPSSETYKYMINLSIKMKDFEGAFELLASLDEKKIMPTASMYNSIMAGYFREKDVGSGFMILKKMEQADVKPDSETFYYLLNNAQCVEDIEKYNEEMKRSGVTFTKYVFMGLINGYVKCGQFEKAKQVVLDDRVQPKNIIEIKSALLLALASSGQMSEAIKIYEEMKLSGLCPEANAVIGLIDHTQLDGKLDMLLHFLGDLNNKSRWCDGCGRIILYCVQHKNLSCAIDLLKQLRERDESAADYVSDQAFGLIYDMDPADVNIGMSLLKGIKDHIGLFPSRTSLDFLLSACLAAKDADTAQLIWKEYQKANIPFNVLTSLRMYQVLLASGRLSLASKYLKRVEKDDPHVRVVIKASRAILTKNVKAEV